VKIYLPKRKKMNIKYYESPEGYTIMVGMDDMSNDYLSIKVAGQSDYWFHVAGFPGSHVVLKCGGNKPGKESIEAAAALAAWFSKMRKGGRVSVSCCLAKNVKKPKKAKPGTVTIKGEKIVKVRPELFKEIQEPEDLN
jgi:predicted ribosome quality control (RQC) complex YloA/Tae2 family protein